MRSQSLRVLSRVWSLSTPPQSSGSKSRRRILEVILIGCAMNSLCAIRQLIDLRSQDEIAFAQAVDFVRPDRDLHSAPGKTDVRMMTLLFRQLADSVGEGECVAKIFERKVFFQMMLVDDLPAISEFPSQVVQRLSLQWRHAAFARDAISFGQLAHDALIIGPSHPHFQHAVGW